MGKARLITTTLWIMVILSCIGLVIMFGRGLEEHNHKWYSPIVLEGEIWHSCRCGAVRKGED